MLDFTNPYPDLSYAAYEGFSAVTRPARNALAAIGEVFDSDRFSTPWTRAMAAACDIGGVEITHGDPGFGISTTCIGGRTVGVEEVVLLRRPYFEWIHFKADTKVARPLVLLVPPMSGHFPTLLRAKVEALLPEHDVFMPRWLNARDIPRSEEAFGFDSYVSCLMEFCEYLGSSTHVIAVCQPGPTALAAAALMSQHGSSNVPKSLILLGAPMDVRINPTKVGKFAVDHTEEWFVRNLIKPVPLGHGLLGAGRRVYPGFLQLLFFMSMNLDRHSESHLKRYLRTASGDSEGAAKIRRFYDDFLAVFDLTEEFYRDTLDFVFQNHHLPRGLLTCNGERVDPSAISGMRLVAIEGGYDDITGLGQTAAALGWCPDCPKEHHVFDVGHYGLFNGKRARGEILPAIAEAIRNSEQRAKTLVRA